MGSANPLDREAGLRLHGPPGHADSLLCVWGCEGCRCVGVIADRDNIAGRALGAPSGPIGSGASTECAHLLRAYKSTAPCEASAAPLLCPGRGVASVRPSPRDPGQQLRGAECLVCRWSGEGQSPESGNRADIHRRLSRLSQRADGSLTSTSKQVRSFPRLHCSARRLTRP